MKIASLVTGILSIVLSAIPILGIILGIVAAVTAYLSRPIQGMATAGLVCGIVGLCLSLLFTSCISCAMCSAIPAFSL